MQLGQLNDWWSASINHEPRQTQNCLPAFTDNHFHLQLTDFNVRAAGDSARCYVASRPIEAACFSSQLSSRPIDWSGGYHYWLRARYRSGVCSTICKRGSEGGCCRYRCSSVLSLLLDMLLIVFRKGGAGGIGHKCLSTRSSDFYSRRHPRSRVLS